ncbi:monocarboxylate transporter 13-like [Acanthaster planci]|uniref:Monocarboxylate transporter 13-like n=1 Tax=Acanthaster planci TaxID=133434 RepID=A0A8B8A170_ACAPL|nr:monocarboxylate transporter 13-like [Acanthaster planci]XP_022110735.1 monocarboxylate transporter 13-like [Acanthaster planci]
MEEQSAAHFHHPWRWMILFSRFFWTFMCLGSFKSMGVLIPHFVDSFSTSTTVAGLVSSFLLGFGLLTFGPFIGAMMKVWDCRKLFIVGGLLVGICMTAAPFSNTMTVMGVFFALMSIGFAFIQVSSVKPLMDYFPDTFATANGVSLSGGTIGMMVIPPLMEYLVECYGWRSALALLGAFSFNHVVCGALLRPLHSKPRKYDLLPSHNDDVDPKYLKSSSQSSNSQRERMTSRVSVKKICSILLEFLRDRFDTEVLTEPVFVLYQLTTILNGMVYSMWHLFLIPQGIELGFGDRPAAFLATYGGLGSLVGRLGHGTAVDRGLIKASTLLALSALLFAVTCGLNPLATSSYTTLAIYAVVSGIAIGAIYPLCFVVMREITGDQQTSAYSWLFLSHGGGQLLGGFFAGWIHDVTENYEFDFLGMGALGALMVINLVLTRCLTHCCEARD